MCIALSIGSTVKLGYNDHGYNEFTTSDHFTT